MLAEILTKLAIENGSRLSNLTPSLFAGLPVFDEIDSVVANPQAEVGLIDQLPSNRAQRAVVHSSWDDQELVVHKVESDYQVDIRVFVRMNECDFHSHVRLIEDD